MADPHAMPPAATTGPLLRGRRREVAALLGLAAAVRDGRSGALLLLGEEGLGKSALLDHVVSGLDAEFQVERIAAVEPEMELPYAGLHQLCGRMTAELERLPPPQRAALESAFGLSTTPPASPFLVGLATLGLLNEAAAARPVICVVDDAQWLDGASARALAFVARRLGAERIALVLAMRTAGDELADLPRLLLDGLSDADARELVRETTTGPIDPVVLDQLVAEAGGNPRALRELPRDFATIDGPHRGPLPGTSRTDEPAPDGLAGLSPAARELVLLAAADPTGDPALLARASAALGLAGGALEEAERAGLLTVGARVGFRRLPLRAAVYRSAAAQLRRRAHGALADATDPLSDPDRRAWHRAHATLDPDEEVAAELERSAMRARARDGVAASAAFLERAAALSPEASARAARLVAAAEARLEAGTVDAAQRLLDAVPEESLSPAAQARAMRLRAQTGNALRRSPDTVRDLLAAARQLEPLDLALARATYHEALFEAQLTGRMGATATTGRPSRTAPRLSSVGRAVLTVVDGPGADEPTTQLLRGQALMASGDPAAAAPVLQHALARLAEAPQGLGTDQWMMVCGRSAIDAWDIGTMRALAERQITLARADGALGVLPAALNYAMLVRLLEGRFAEAVALGGELAAVSDVTRRRTPVFAPIVLAAWHGDEAEVRRRGEALRTLAAEQQAGALLNMAAFAETLLLTGLGRYADAVDIARTELPHCREGGLVGRTLAELIEAAVRSGQRELAETALEELVALAEPFGTDWARGVIAQGRAHLDDTEDGEAHHREAIVRLGRAGLRLQEGRARLGYGEWLRRHRRRVDARVQLRTAHETLSAAGARPFAARAARELEATGEVARSRAPGVADALTVQEENVARMAREGMTNRDIATRLFISVRTVEYHLRKVFVKLDIRSRQELADALDGAR